MPAGAKGYTLTWTSILAASPWVLCLLAFSGPFVATTFLVTCIVLMFVGLALLRALVPTLRLGSWLLLSLPIGLLVASFLASLAARFGIDLRVPAAVLVLMSITGARSVVARQVEVVAFSRTIVPVGGLAVLLSTSICAVYFAPAVLWDGTFRPDGSFGWLYLDCQWYMAMTTSILRGGTPPDMPGLAGAPLWYHYGRFAVAAMVHEVSPCNVADSLFRIVGGVGRISLALSTMALGGALGASADKRWLVGLLAVFGFFFVGWTSWPFVALAQARLIPWIPAPPQQNWAPFGHTIHATSLLWGSIGLFVVLSLLLESYSSPGKKDHDEPALPFLAILAIPMHGLAALGAAGVSWMELAFRNRKHPLYLTAIGVGLAAATLIYWISMNPFELVGNTFSVDPDPRPEIFEMFMYFFFGLGVLLLGMDWIRSFPRTAASRVYMMLMVGFLPLTPLLENRGFNDYYGVRFATTIVSVFAMARFGTWLGEDFFVVARRVLLRLGTVTTVTASGFLLLSLGIIVSVGPGTVRFAALPVVATAVAFGGLLLVWSSRRGRVVVAAVSAIVGAIFVVQATAWVPVFVDVAIRKDREHRLSTGEVKGLLRLKELSHPQSLCVTNRQEVPGLRFRPERSYMYTALSERAFVLEGWRFREMDAPSFEDARSFSESVFATRNPVMLCAILRRRGVDFIVARPDTDLYISEEDCECIRQIPDCGSLTVYSVE